jgi:hypothetical protein
MDCFLLVVCETGQEIKPTSDGLSGWDLLVEAASGVKRWKLRKLEAERLGKAYG